MKKLLLIAVVFMRTALGTTDLLPEKYDISYYDEYREIDSLAIHNTDYDKIHFLEMAGTLEGPEVLIALFEDPEGTPSSQVPRVGIIMDVSSTKWADLCQDNTNLWDACETIFYFPDSCYSPGFSITTGDYDGDGNLDLALGDPQAMRFYTKESYNVSTQSIDETAADINSGAVYIIHKITEKIESTTLNFNYSRANLDQNYTSILGVQPASLFGQTVESAYFNLDTLYTDLIIGSPGAYAWNDQGIFVEDRSNTDKIDNYYKQYPDSLGNKYIDDNWALGELDQLNHSDLYKKYIEELYLPATTPYYRTDEFGKQVLLATQTFGGSLHILYGRSDWHVKAPAYHTSMSTDLQMAEIIGGYHIRVGADEADCALEVEQAFLGENHTLGDINGDGTEDLYIGTTADKYGLEFRQVYYTKETDKKDTWVGKAFSTKGGRLLKNYVVTNPRFDTYGELHKIIISPDTISFFGQQDVKKFQGIYEDSLTLASDNLKHATWTETEGENIGEEISIGEPSYMRTIDFVGPDPDFHLTQNIAFSQTSIPVWSGSISSVTSGYFVEDPLSELTDYDSVASWADSLVYSVGKLGEPNGDPMPRGAMATTSMIDSMKEGFANAKNNSEEQGYHYKYADIYVSFDQKDESDGNMGFFNILCQGSGNYLKDKYTKMFNAGQFAYNLGDMNGDQLEELLQVSYSPKYEGTKIVEYAQEFKLLYGKDSYSGVSRFGVNPRHQKVISQYNQTRTGELPIDRYNSTLGRYTVDPLLSFGINSAFDQNQINWFASPIANIRLDCDSVRLDDFYLPTRIDTTNHFKPHEVVIYNTGADTLTVSEIKIGSVTRDQSLVGGQYRGAENWNFERFIYADPAPGAKPIQIEPQSYYSTYIYLDISKATHGNFNTTVSIKSDDWYRPEIEIPVEISIYASDIALNETGTLDTFAVNVPNQVIKARLDVVDGDTSEFYTYYVDYEEQLNNHHSISLSNNGNLPLQFDHIEFQLEAVGGFNNYSKINVDTLAPYFQVFLTDITNPEAVIQYPLVLTDAGLNQGDNVLRFFRGSQYSPELPAFGGRGSIDIYFSPIDFVNLEGSFNIYSNDPGNDPDFETLDTTLSEDPKSYEFASIVAKAPALHVLPEDHIFELSPGVEYDAVTYPADLTIDFDMGRVRMVNADSAGHDPGYPIGSVTRDFVLNNFGNRTLDISDDYLQSHPYYSYQGAFYPQDSLNSGWLTDAQIDEHASFTQHFKFVPGDHGYFETAYRIEGDTAKVCDPHISFPEGHIFQERSYLTRIKGVGYRPDIHNYSYDHFLGQIDLNESNFYHNDGMIANDGNLDLNLDLNEYSSRIFPIESNYVPGQGSTQNWADLYSSDVYPGDSLHWRSELLTDNIYWSSWSIEKMIEIIVPLENNDPWTADDPQYIRFTALISPEDPPVPTEAYTPEIESILPYAGPLNAITAESVSYDDTTGARNQQNLLFGFQHQADSKSRSLDFVYENKESNTLYINLPGSYRPQATNYTTEIRYAPDEAVINETQIALESGEKLYFTFTNIIPDDPGALTDSLFFTFTDSLSKSMLIEGSTTVSRWYRNLVSGVPEREIRDDEPVTFVDTLNWMPVNKQVILLNSNFQVTATNRIESIDHLALDYGQVSTTQFADELGRVVETHVFDGETEIVSGTGFDDYGRIVKNYLPIELRTGYVDYFGTNLADSVKRFYNYFDEYGLDSTQAFSLTVSENSPLKRVMKTMTPGQQGVSGSILETVNTYSVSDENRIAFLTETLLPSGVTLKNYANLANQKTITSTIKGGESSTTSFFYDDMGNMMKSQPPINPGETADSVASRYYYNSLGQLVKKQMPDAHGDFLYKYDVVGNMRYYSDPNCAAKGDFYYYNYDVHGRVVEFGVGVGDNLPVNTSQNFSGGTPLILYTYDKPSFDAAFTQGRLTHIRYNLRWAPNTEDILGCDQSWFSYDEDGKVAWMRTDLYEVNGDASYGREYFKVANTWLLNGAKRESRYYVGNENNEALIFYTRNEYDSFGRLSNVLGGRNEYLATIFSKYRYHFDGKLKWEGYKPEPRPYSEDDSLKWETDATWQEKNYSYDYLGRLAGINDVNEGTPENHFSATYDYNIEGNIETLVEKNWMLDGADIRLDMGYTYDYLNRLKTATVQKDQDQGDYYAELGYSYDARGNITLIGRDFYLDSYNDSLSMKYILNSNRLDTVRDLTGDWAQAYDLNGNLTQDLIPSPDENLDTYVEDVGYNFLNLPEMVKLYEDGTSYAHMNFAYSPDGQRISKRWMREDGSEGGEEYYFLDESGQKVGVFTKDEEGFLQTKHVNILGGSGVIGRFNPDSAAIGSSDSLVLYMKDHLGSVRYAFKDNYVPTSGQPYVKNIGMTFAANYLPFGGYLPVSAGRQTQDEEFTGKELDDQFGLNWHYFGARYYRSRIGTFAAIDRYAEIYPSNTPYHYVLNNPIKSIDVNGDFTLVQSVPDGSYSVIKGGKPNSDTGIYTISENGEWNKIGSSLTTHSFFDDNGIPVVGAILDPFSTEGQKFIDDEIIAANPSLSEYKANVLGLKIFNFKDRGLGKRAKDVSVQQHRYRGSVAENGTFGSARDFGNMGAGIVAARGYLSWTITRLIFDYQESKQKGYKTVEGPTSQKAQKIGHDAGLVLRKGDLTGSTNTEKSSGPQKLQK